MKSMCHQSRRNSPSVTSCMPTDSCFATASRMCLSCRARSASALISPRFALTRASCSSAGRKRLPTWSARKGGVVRCAMVTPGGCCRGLGKEFEAKRCASGNIGAEMVARSAPDGHTVMITANTMLIAATLYRNVPYDPLTDFSPISLAAWGTLLLTANPKANINSVADLIAQAKASPGKLTYASPGVGTPHHMSMELFKDLTGTNLLHVPYKGSAGALTDLLSGEVNVGFVPIHVAMPHVKAGRLKALAVGSAKRHPNAPDVPSLQESGVK